MPAVQLITANADASNQSASIINTAAPMASADDNQALHPRLTGLYTNSSGTKVRTKSGGHRRAHSARNKQRKLSSSSMNNQRRPTQTGRPGAGSTNFVESCTLSPLRAGGHQEGMEDHEELRAPIGQHRAELNTQNDYLEARSQLGNNSYYPSAFFTNCPLITGQNYPPLISDAVAASQIFASQLAAQMASMRQQQQQQQSIRNFSTNVGPPSIMPHDNNSQQRQQQQQQQQQTTTCGGRPAGGRPRCQPCFK